MPESIFKASCTSARHAGSFDCLMASLILITMDNSRGHCAWWQSCAVPNQTHKGINKKMKIYAIKQIKICAEYRDMLPRPRLDLSGTPGLRPIGLSPGYWQTSLGLGSMSRYFAQILICILKLHMLVISNYTCVDATRQTDRSIKSLWEPSFCKGEPSASEPDDYIPLKHIFNEWRRVLNGRKLCSKTSANINWGHCTTRCEWTQVVGLFCNAKRSFWCRSLNLKPK